MSKPLRVLIVEDSEFDAQMLVAVLKKGGYGPIFERVETADQMRAALKNRTWDIILADYNLPQFSAPAALNVLRETGLDLPFIIVSGAIGEHTAVESMKSGAHDYLMKGNLVRLVPAVERELREASNRIVKTKTAAALRESESRYRLLWETATDAIVLIDTSSTVHFANPAVEEIFGYHPSELVGRNLSILQPEWLQARHAEGLARYLQEGVRRINWRAFETVGRRKDGSEIAIELAFSDMEFEGRRWFVGFIRDVTDRKRAEQELKSNQEQFRVAREIQQHLFPKAAPVMDGVDIAGASHPAEATGGDYFDYLPMLNEGIGLVIGDVAGHGVGPALLMAEARAYLRILAKNRDDLGDIFARINMVLGEDVGFERYVTLLLARIDPSNRTLVYANAGHPPGYILNSAGEIKKQLTRTGIALGVRPDATYSASPAIPLDSGDIVLLLTDGFEEAVSEEDAMFGIERILEVVRDQREKPAAEIVQALYDSVDDFAGRMAQTDDLTVIIAKIS